MTLLPRHQDFSNFYPEINFSWQPEADVKKWVAYKKMCIPQFYVGLGHFISSKLNYERILKKNILKI